MRHWSAAAAAAAFQSDVVVDDDDVDVGPRRPSCPKQTEFPCPQECRSILQIFKKEKENLSSFLLSARARAHLRYLSKEKREKLMRCARAKHARAHTRSRTCRLTDGERGEGREGGRRGAVVRPSVRQSVSPSVRPFVCPFVCRSVDGERFFLSSSSSHSRGAGAGAGRGRIKKQKNCKRVCVYGHSSYLFLGYLFFLICVFKQLLLLLYRLYRLSLSLSLTCFGFFQN